MADNQREKELREYWTDWFNTYYWDENDTPAYGVGDTLDDGTVLTEDEAREMSASDKRYGESLEYNRGLNELKQKMVDDAVRESLEAEKQTDRMKMTTKSKMRVVGGRKRR